MTDPPTDVSDRDRTFIVYISHGYAGCPDEELEVHVPAGEDATPICEEAWNDLVNNLDSGWYEK